MLLARVILIGICVVLAALNFWIWHQPWALGYGGAGYVISPISAIPFLASLVIFTFSFLKAEKTADGQILINENHPYFKIVKWFGGIFCEKGSPLNNQSKLSICKIYWITVWGIFLVLTALAVLALLIFYVIADWRKTLILMGSAVGIMALVGGGAFLASRIKLKESSQKAAWVTLGVALIVFLAFIAPMLYIMHSKHVSLKSALPEYGTGMLAIAVVAGGLIVTAVLIVGTFVTMKALRKTFLGQILATGWRAVKTRTCPIFTTPEELKPATEAGNPNIDN